MDAYTRLSKTRCSWRSLSAAGLLAAWLSACGPAPGDSLMQAERSLPETRRTQAPLPAALGETEALKLVKAHEEPDSGLVVEDWVRRQLDEVQGEILFPNWDARRRGAHKYEVTFTYTVLKDNYSIEKNGFSWLVDLQMSVVGPVRTLEPEDMSRSRIRESSSGSLGDDYGLGLD